MLRSILIAASLIALLAPAGRVSAETRLYTIAIGNNSPPASGGDDSLATLRYADDDAAAFFRFARPLSDRADVLAVLDPESQRRFPELVGVTRPSSLAELLRIVAEVRAEMRRDLSRGDRPVLLLFYSGHGVHQSAGRPAALALVDGELTQQRLYDEILAVLPARAVHLLIDACYAEDVVRPRDAQAKVVDVSAGDLARLVQATTLARFPHVGAVVAASLTGETHEWDTYRQGVFTHQLLSGLRGAADVNVDGAVEYSELAAFLSAANREVADPRARLHVISRPPSIDRRLPIIELSRLKHNFRLLAGRATPAYFFVEDQQGNRLVDMRVEPNYPFQLHLPPDQVLYFVSSRGTAELQPTADQAIRIDHLTLQDNPVRARGGMTTAMRRGLFRATFGPSYYRGFVDSAPELVSVDFADPLGSPPASRDTPKVFDGPVFALLGTAGALAAISTTFGILASQARDDFERTSFQRQAAEASDRFTRDRGIAIGAGVAAGIATGIAGWLIWDHRKRRGGAGRGVAPEAGPASAEVLTW